MLGLSVFLSEADDSRKVIMSFASDASARGESYESQNNRVGNKKICEKDKLMRVDICGVPILKIHKLGDNSQLKWEKGMMEFTPFELCVSEGKKRWFSNHSVL